MRGPRVALTRMLLCFLLYGGAGVAHADIGSGNARIDTPGILSASMDLSCQAYRPIGLCIWMTCTLAICEFDFSVRAEHYIPEVVVTAYPILGRSSWPESNGFAQPTQFAQEGGASDEGGTKTREQALKFKNSDVIGSPGVAQYRLLSAASTDVLPFCTPLTHPMTPYFVSSFDPAWRNPLIEVGLSLGHAFDRVGKGAATFAALYPRHGFISQSHDYKSALTAAMRAMDIVSQSHQPHVYVPLDSYGASGQGQWPPRGLQAARYQQLTPTVEACSVLPDIDDTLHPTDPYAGRLNQNLGNAWQVWRPYRCCEPAGTVLIATL